MTTMTAALAAAMKLACAIAAGTVLLASGARADWKAPWKDETRALVIDAYEFNPIDWEKMTGDDRIAGFINKASDGLPPDWRCGKLTGDDEKLCKNRWWKYEVTKELYMTRRAMAKMKGLLWGAYHLGRPGNPREQADHFIDFAEPGPDELIALDIEDNTSEWMSLADAEIFADQIKIRTGRYPVLYTNGSTAQFVSDHAETYPLLSRLPLWYARYRDDITGKFPTETWPSYALWQFSSMHNCNARSCPYRVAGAKTDIDVNVSPLTVAELRQEWPFRELLPRRDAVDPGALIASVSDGAKQAVAEVVQVAETEQPAPVAAEPGGSLVAAYGPTEAEAPRIDPLELLTAAAHEKPPASIEAAKVAALDARDPTATGSVRADNGANAAAKQATAAFHAIEPAIFAQSYAAALKGLALAATQVPLLARGESAVPAHPQRETSLQPRSRLSEILAAKGDALADVQGPAAPADILSEARAVFGQSRGGRILRAGAPSRGTLTAELEAADARVSDAFAATR